MDTIQKLRVVEKDRGKLSAKAEADQDDGGPKFCEGFPGESRTRADEGLYDGVENKAVLSMLPLHQICPLLE